MTKRSHFLTKSPPVLVASDSEKELLEPESQYKTWIRHKMIRIQQKMKRFCDNTLALFRQNQ
ncbi:hypothetical protein D3C87_1749530 [compost metagenome]